MYASSVRFIRELTKFNYNVFKREKAAQKLSNEWLKANKAHIGEQCVAMKRTMGAPGDLFFTRDEAKRWMKEQITNDKEPMTNYQSQGTTQMKYPIQRLLPLLLALLLVGCTVATPASPPADEAAATTATDGAFPVTIEHKYGSTTITEKPERIVLVGLVEQDALLALGVVPVATSEWWGGRPGAIFEWASDELGDAPLPEVLSGEGPNFERIAALQPDVIVGLYAGLTAEQYETLSQIAPTVAQPGEYPDWGIPWQDLTEKIGLIVGERAKAGQLITELEARFAQIREQHPEFAAADAVVASYSPESFWAYSSQDPRGQFLTTLGGWTITGANLILDDIEQYLLNQ